MKRTTIMIALCAAAFITGCAKSDEQVIVTSCLEADESLNEAYCACTYDKMEASLSDEVLANIAEAIRDGAADPIEAISTLPPQQQMSVLPVTLQLLECAQELE
ncbi:hypothetical protein [Ponticaulis koreensis]|uniref:hypothetical protein n=1 Tax=Ponticaulis koreensis TaxID=1123045 RepID=UPI0003B2EE5F|nr:hypothetical protein [Ponticaulis koreensis]